MHCLTCFCVEVNDEHRKATCSRASCVAAVSRPAYSYTDTNWAAHATLSHTCTSNCKFRFFQRSLSWIQLVRRLKLLLTRCSLRSAEKKVVGWNHIIVQPKQQRLNRLSDFHRTFYRRFLLYKTSCIRLCFREEWGSDNHILLYGINKCLSVLSVLFGPSRWISRAGTAQSV
jgi:hypothetical protein